jgi:hypothetical protein
MRAFLRSAACALAAALLPGLVRAAAGEFSLVEQFRNYYVSADPAAVGVDGNHTEHDVPIFASSDAPGLLQVGPIHQRLVAVSPDGTATATGDVSLSHVSVIDRGLISFESSVSASAEVMLADPRARGFVSATSSSGMNATFDILQPMAVVLTMHSAIEGPNATFGFDLRRGDVVVWDDESVLDPATGMPVNDFTRVLTLEPGRYLLSAGLGADARPAQPSSFGTAGFVLAAVPAVPEPAVWLLMVAGLAGVAAAKRLSRRGSAALRA